MLSQPLQLSGHECHTTASIGIATYPSDGIDAATLTKNADMAMYLAKEDGKNGFRFFSRDIKVQFQPGGSGSPGLYLLDGMRAGTD